MRLPSDYLSKGFVRRGHRVPLRAQAGSPLDDRARAAGVETLGLRMRGEFDFRAVLRLAPLFGERRLDIVHAHTSHAQTLASLAAWLLGRRRPGTLPTRRADFSIYRHETEKR